MTTAVGSVYIIAPTPVGYKRLQGDAVAACTANK